MSYTPKGLLECGNIDSQGAGLRDCQAQVGREELAVGCLAWPPQARHLLLCPWATQLMAVAVAVAAAGERGGAGVGASAMNYWDCSPANSKGGQVQRASMSLGF